MGFTIPASWPTLDTPQRIVSGATIRGGAVAKGGPRACIDADRYVRAYHCRTLVADQREVSCSTSYQTVCVAQVQTSPGAGGGIAVAWDCAPSSNTLKMRVTIDDGTSTTSQTYTRAGGPRDISVESVWTPGSVWAEDTPLLVTVEVLATTAAGTHYGVRVDEADLTTL